MRKPHTVNLEDDVFTYLQQESRPLEGINDVLRRLLKPGKPPRRKTSSPENSMQRRPGALMPLLKAGLLKANDELIHEQPRKGLVHRGAVTADGWVRVGEREFPSPSPALKICVEHEVNGWAEWVHQRSGHSLNVLRTMQ